MTTRFRITIDMAKLARPSSERPDQPGAINRRANQSQIRLGGPMNVQSAFCRGLFPSLFVILVLSSPAVLNAQRAPGEQSSGNIHVLAHIPVGRGPSPTGYQ